jgi:hypothetical protein
MAIIIIITTTEEADEEEKAAKQEKRKKIRYNIYIWYKKNKKMKKEAEKE